jgi:hypothetical protein
MQAPNMPDPRDYPGPQPVDTPPHAPAINGTPVTAAPDQQNGSASTATAQKPVSRKRKGHAEQQEEENEDSEATKKTKGSKGEKGVQTKNRKVQDQKDRESLSRKRDEAVRRVFDIASRYIPPGADRDAYEKEAERVQRMDKEIDGNTELYIPWNSTRADLRKTDRAVPERKQED